MNIYTIRRMRSWYSKLILKTDTEEELFLVRLVHCGLDVLFNVLEVVAGAHHAAGR